MRIDEITNRKYYHGSSIHLPVGAILKARDEYEAEWQHTDFYNILEHYRPANQLSHKQSVFMCDNSDDIDSAGGGTDWMFTLKPLGLVQKHDLNWSSEISCLISDGFAPNSEEIEDAARKYWAGIPHHNESLWEYLTPSALIIAVEPF